MLGELLPVDGGEVVRHGIVPEPVEPLLDFGHDARLILTEVELEVRGEAGEGEVRRSGEHPVLPGEEKGLPVEEAVLVAAHLDLPGVQEFEELAGGGAAPWGERQTVSVAPEPPLRVLQLFVRELLVVALAARLPQPAFREPRGRHGLGA